jgi:putative hemolysin
VRAGSYIGDGAVIDKQFGTTDVLIYFPVSHIGERWRSKFGRG